MYSLGVEVLGDCVLVLGLGLYSLGVEFLGDCVLLFLGLVDCNLGELFLGLNVGLGVLLFTRFVILPPPLL